MKVKTPTTSIYMGFSVPVAIVIFNRPEITSLLINTIKNQNISILFVIADGPRNGNLEDITLCSETRAIIDAAPWKCEVRKLYRDVNVGCGHGPSSGLDWVFSQVDRCIILEDDCIPDPSFFRFCSELLERYELNDQVMMISGDNYFLGRYQMQESYLFSVNTQTHGWATWRRAWNKYDFYMQDWPSTRSLSWLTSLLGNKKYAKNWIDNFDHAYEQSNSNPRCSFWDYQWIYACWKNGGLCILPQVNLITNIGYGELATHTLEEKHPLSSIPSESIRFPLNHPKEVLRNFRADEILRRTAFGFKPFYLKVLHKVSNAVKKIIQNKMHNSLQHGDSK